MKDAKKKVGQFDTSTEEKILAAAKKIFTQKGYEATKVRDIATEADINLSLVNYYFRSKEKLFEVIVKENINNLFDKIGPVLNDEKSTLKEKVKFIAGYYIDMLLANPDMPRFVVNEVLSGKGTPVIGNKPSMIMNSYFAKQIFALQSKGKIDYHPMQLLISLIGMIIMPFLAQNMLIKVGVKKDMFRQMMEERKQLIPLWIETIIKS